MGTIPATRLNIAVAAGTDVIGPIGAINTPPTMGMPAIVATPAAIRAADRSAPAGNSRP